MTGFKNIGCQVICDRLHCYDNNYVEFWFSSLKKEENISQKLQG